MENNVERVTGCGYQSLGCVCSPAPAFKTLASHGSVLATECAQLPGQFYLTSVP